MPVMYLVRSRSISGAARNCATALSASALSRSTRHAAGSRRITGYAHESWHFRFVGRPLATYLHRERIATLEEAFGLRGADS